MENLTNKSLGGEQFGHFWGKELKTAAVVTSAVSTLTSKQKKDILKPPNMEKAQLCSDGQKGGNQLPCCA